VFKAKDGGSGGDNWSYKSCRAPVKSSSLTKQWCNAMFIEIAFTQANSALYPFWSVNKHQLWLVSKGG